jgi:hypothetical protein
MPRLVLLILIGLTSTGCVNRWNTRFPSWHTSSTASQKREAQLQDPFPDESGGPEMGIRPRGFDMQRTEPLRAKQSYAATMQRQQLNPQFGPAIGGGAQYPTTVVPR